MKKIALIATLLILTVTVSAEELADFSTLTIAAADTNQLSWTFEKSERRVEHNASKALTKKVEALSERVNATLEKRLQEKFARQFEF